MYKVFQIWPGLIVYSLHTKSPGHIWTTLYNSNMAVHKVVCVKRSGCKVHGMIVLHSLVLLE